MKTPDRFTLTHEHLKLLRRMYVGWQDCETGAPEIDQKRPYGNSSVAEDVAEILGMEPADSDNGEPTLSQAQRERCATLHRETETALQIFLRCGTVAEATYRRGDAYSEDWKRE